MKRSRLGWIVALAVFGAWASTAIAQQRARDAATPTTGSAVVSGTVVVAGTGEPVRRARVVLNAGTVNGGLSTIADERGRFVFEHVPASRYTLSARKDGLIETNYGARRENGPGTELAVAAGQRLEGLEVRMPRGAAISGRIAGSDGEPAGDIRVSLFRVRMIDGQRALVSSTNVMTDDRGVYRIAVLPAGEYIVSATAESTAGQSGFRRITDADIQAAMVRAMALPVPVGPGAIIGAPAPPPAPVKSAADHSFAPTFYPDTPFAEGAQVITLTAGEERTGIDFVVLPVRAARIDGIVVDPQQRGIDTMIVVDLTPRLPPGSPQPPSRSASVQMSAQGAQFSMPGIVPGSYTLSTVIRLPVAPNDGFGPTPSPLSAWARHDLEVSGDDVSGVTLVLQPGMTLRGRVAIESSPKRPPPTADDFGRVRLLTEVHRGNTISTLRAASAPSADGTFSIPGLLPGRYRFTAVYGTPDSATWIVKSVMLNGRDFSELPSDLFPDDLLNEMVITLTDQTAEISGVLVDPDGKPASDYYVVIFPSDRRYWVRGSRRLTALRPASDGRYIAKNLPAGEYRIGAVTDMEPSDLGDSTFLEQLLAASVPITLGGGERKVQDLRVGRR